MILTLVLVALVGVLLLLAGLILAVGRASDLIKEVRAELANN
jgi:hypothetical protein